MTFSTEDLQKIAVLIKDVPFQYSFPIFQYFAQHLEQERVKQLQPQTDGQTDTRQN